MRKGTSVLVAVIVIIILAVAGYAIFHKSDNKPSSTAGTNTTASSNVPDVNNAVLTTKTDSKLGKYLADPSGKALYTYNADSNAVSNCTGSCLANWPAYVDKGSTTNLPTGVGTIKRSDNGQTQFTYNGMPLYYFASDSNGQVTGDGVENFSVAKPATTNGSSNQSTPDQSNVTNSSKNPY